MCKERCEYPGLFTLLILKGFPGIQGFRERSEKLLNRGNWQGFEDGGATPSCRWNMSDIPGVAPSCVKTLVAELAALRYMGSWVQIQGLWEPVPLGETSV